MSQKKFRIISYVCAIMLLVSGCSYSLPDIENHLIEDSFSKNATVYRTFYASEVVSLNYLTSDSDVDCGISVNVIDALVDYDEHGNIIPGLATGWESNDDLTQWTFHLRDDIVWVDYNGEYYANITADDWVCSYEYANSSISKDVSISSVVAKNTKTLVYTLNEPCPFFTSILSYSCFLPVCRSYLEKTGSMFARDYKHLLYNGAYILHYFQPFEQQILVKNPKYWDKDKVYIDRIENYFDYDAASVSTERYLKGTVDRAIVPSDKLTAYLDDPEISEHIHRARPDNTISTFYAFNFYPRFDPKYEPENWAKAVVNQNFRKAIKASIDRVSLLSIYEPYTPEILLNNTLTPEGAFYYDGVDYTSLPELKEIASKDSYSLAAASYYRKIARKELREEGVTFPIKILMPYNPSVEGWGKEADKIATQIEAAMGRNFVDVIVEPASSTGFDMSVIHSGKYALIKCSTSSAYYDPQTFVKPLLDGSDYIFWDKCDDPNVHALNKEWNNRIQKASNTTSDLPLRYSTFAQAEKLVISHAIIIPFSIMNGDGYEMCKLNEFEGEFAHYSFISKRYKLHRLHDKSMNLEEYNKALEEWLQGF